MNFVVRNGALDVLKLYAKWHEFAKNKNCGALLTFCGIVRQEEGIEALSFDIYEPLLKKWFHEWEKRVKNDGAFLFFAHSMGDVKVYQSSYLAGILSKQRKLGLSLIHDFVEDFKANAPIWKYDVINKQRIYAQQRSHKLAGAGLLQNKEE